MAKQFLILFSILTTWATISCGQHSSPYSLQSAVDALHRREAQLALKDNYDPSIRHTPSLEDGSYWADTSLPDSPPYRGNRQQLNKLLANYLAREEEDEDNAIYPPTDYEDAEDDYRSEDRKRSMFRERGDDLPYQSVFREREMDIHPDLTEEFLREIDRQRNVEREEKYRETLHRLWEKYQQQENEIERELFDEEQKRSGDVPQDNFMYYAPAPMAKKSYPILPWLPASKKKRFPVAKRSPKSYENMETPGTNEKVSKDLDALFGEPIEEKKKRSSDDALLKTDGGAPQSTTTMTSEKDQKKTNHGHNHEHKHGEHDHEHEHDHDDEEEPEEHESEHDEHDEDDEDHDFDDSDEDNHDDKKKKRAIFKKKRSNLEVVKEDQIIPGDITDFKKKKSIQWSKYFGMDRRKKSMGWIRKNQFHAATKKDDQQSPDDFPLHNFKNHDGSHEPQFTTSDGSQNGNDDKLKNMNDKLKTIENLIIDETVKYTGAYEGISNPDDIRRLKDHVVSRLATAYSLEKMRRALEKLKESVEQDQHLQKNEIEEKDDKEKRVAIKKEKVQFDDSNHKVEAPAKTATTEPDNHLDANEEDKKKKKKSLPYPEPLSTNDLNEFEEELGAGHFIEPMSEGYIGGDGRGLIDGGNVQCPILDAIEKRCRSVDLLSGDIHQELLPICGIHQLCYICGTTQTACDFQYLSEADSICGHNTECQSAARSALMILRGTPNPQLGPKECAKNSCLYRAMRDIGL